MPINNSSWQQIVGSAAVGTAVGFALYHHQSPFAQKRRELGRREEASIEFTVQALSSAAIGYIIAAHAKSGYFPLTGPREPLHVALGLAVLTTIMELPNALAEKRDLQLFTLNRAHDFIMVATVATIVKQFI